MGLRMWKGGKSNDFNLFDKAIGAQFNMGGTDMWLYAYKGPTGNKGSTDSTLPDYSTGNGGVSSIGDLVLGETTDRDYSLDAITLPCVYQVLEATPDLKFAGLIFNPMKMAITVHYNTMIQRLGRKIIPGDVLELPNLRDTDVLGKEIGINRFYVVVDAFRSAEGYSATWQSHIFKIRVDPLTNSPEYSKLIGDNGFDSGDINDPDPNDPSGSADPSTYDKEMEIMNKIISQGDEDISYIHWTNEHIHDDYKNKSYLIDDILRGYEYPKEPIQNLFFIMDYYPVLFYKDGTEWKEESTECGNEFPKEPYDGMFFFKYNEVSVSSWTLYQYNEEHKKFLQCDLPFTNDPSTLNNDEDFYYSRRNSQLTQYIDSVWTEIDVDSSTKPFSTKDVTGIKNNPANKREFIPPARGTVREGTQFPDDAVDKELFYRTDYKPVTLWQYNATDMLWSQFKYGGRKPWTGANLEQTDYINSDKRVSVHDILKPNTLYRKK